MRRIKVFLDSSVIIASLASITGGSQKVLVLAELGVIIPCVSEDVVSEVIRNMQKKLPGALVHFYALFKTLPFRMVYFTESDVRYAKTMINKKDAPILAAAIAGKVDWLLSLDKHFLTTNWKDRLDIIVASPGEFLQNLELVFRGN